MATVYGRYIYREWGLKNQFDPACTWAKHCIDPYLHDEEDVKLVMKTVSHFYRWFPMENHDL